MSPVLSIRSLSKSFVGTRALNAVDLDLEAGEIRAVVGQNGCGKSTLIKVLAGYYEPDDGAVVTVDGVPLALGHPGAGETAGIRFVHQDLGLVGTLDTVDNLALGRGYQHVSGGRIRWRAEAREAREALAAFGYDFDVRRPVAQLSISERTAVAVARAVSTHHVATKVLVLDEPTANLPASEAARLFALVRRVRDNGIAVLFVSHHLDEVFAVSESVTVLRDGNHIHTGPTTELDEDRLVELMIGRTLAHEHVEKSQADRSDAPVLTARAVATASVVAFDLDLRPGEVVGVAGITGSGREAVALALFGGVARSGDVTVGDRVVPQQRPDRAMAAGVGLVPAERHANAALAAHCLTENVTVTDPGRSYRGGLLRRRSERSDVHGWLGRLQVKPGDPSAKMSTLSGGNQQKVVIARWLRMEPKVLILDEPTQGVDIGAKSEIWRLVDEAAEQGMAVLVVSSDSGELARLASRVLVMRGGVVADELRGDRVETDAITASTLGSSQRDKRNALPTGDPGVLSTAATT